MGFAMSSEEIKALATRLGNCHQVAGLNREGHDEAWTLAHSLDDLGDAARQYLELPPSLFDSRLEGEELIQRLIEILLPVQHMLYHAEDPLFFRGFLEPLRNDWESERAARQ
jgi:hypothetical protein